MARLFDLLFGKKKPDEAAIKTAPLSKERLKEAAQVEVPRLQPAQLDVGCGQSVGLQREHNEDSLFALSTVLSGVSESVPIGLFIIADGMGGHEHGEIASGLAIRAMASHIMDHLYLPLIGQSMEAPAESLQEVMQAGVRKAQQAVQSQVPGGGTTLTTVFVLGDRITIAHVGDSRAYLVYPDGRINPATRDHSFVGRLQELGQLTEVEALHHPQRNILYRAIGQGEPFDADIVNLEFPRPGYLLVCSDGLWGVVNDADILKIMQAAPDPIEAAQRLVAAANDAGGPDNISAIVVRFPI